jgi:hypothetical protein
LPSGLSLLTRSRPSVHEPQLYYELAAMRDGRHVDPDSLRHNDGAEQVADCVGCNCDVEDRQTMVVDKTHKP